MSYDQTAQPEEIDFTFPDIGTMEEEKRKRIKLFAPNIYIVKCIDYKITKSPYVNQYTGQEDINCTWKFEIIKTIDGTPIKYSTGQDAEFLTFPVWSNVFNLGSKKDGKPQDTRAIMSALQGLPSNVVLPKPQAENFIGKTCRVVCEVGVKKNGAPKQIWDAWAKWDVPVNQSVQPQLEQPQPPAEPQPQPQI